MQPICNWRPALTVALLLAAGCGADGPGNRSSDDRPVSARGASADADGRGVAVEGVAGQRWAVLVGVNKYSFLEHLQYCKADAAALRDRLVEAGFPEDNVFLLADGASHPARLPLKSSIEGQLAKVLRGAEKGDLVLVSFSGHGMHLDGKTYLCPTGAKLDDPDGTMVPLAKVYSDLDASQASYKLLWVDACRDDPRPGGRKSTAAYAKSMAGLVESLKAPPKGILTLASCEAGQVSWEEPKFGHGLFMHYMLEGLAGGADREERGNRDDRVSILELYNYANIKTKRFTMNDPRKSLQTPELFGRITGDFDIAEFLMDPLATGNGRTEDRDHPAEGFRDGRLIELGDKQYHAQLLHSVSTHTVTIRMLDAAGKRPVAIGQPHISLQLFKDGEFVDYLLRAAKTIDGKPGTAEFSVADRELCQMLVYDKDICGRLKVTIEGQEYIGVIDSDTPEVPERITDASHMADAPKPTPNEVRVPRKGREYGSGLVGEAPQDHGPVFNQVAQLMNAYKSVHGHFPKSHGEFMEKIIDANRIQLPKLASGQTYFYDAVKAAEQETWNQTDPPLRVLKSR